MATAGDISWESPQGIFNLRVAAILTSGGEILLCTIEGLDYCPARLACASAARRLGARAASSPHRLCQYRPAVAVPIPNPAARSANVSPLRREAGTSSACWAGFRFRPGDPIRAR